MAMRKILLVEDEPDLLEMVKELVEYEIDDIGILTAKNSEEAIAFLEEDDGIVCILSDYFMGGKNGDAVFKYNQENRNVPFSIFTGSKIEELSNLDDFEADNQNNFLLYKPIEEERLLLAVRTMMKSFESSKLPGHVQKYKKVRTTLVKKFLDIRADFYVQLSESKYVKILDSTEEIDLSIIEKYESRGQEFLYMEEVAYLNFFEQTKDIIVDKVENSRGIDSLKTLDDVMNYVHDGLRNFGVRELEIELVADSVNKCLEELESIPSLRKFISRFKSTSGYLVTHSVLSVHTSMMIVKNTEYNNESVLRKMTFAALLHDIGLPNSKLSKILKKSSDDFYVLSQKEKDIVLTHPTLVSQVVGNFHIIPSDVISIIREHHERPDGSGFPRGLSANMISPLSSIFIVASEVADYLVEKNFTIDCSSELISKLKEDLSIGRFEKVIEAAEKSILE